MFNAFYDFNDILTSYKFNSSMQFYEISSVFSSAGEMIKRKSKSKGL